jgi:protease I
MAEELSGLRVAFVTSDEGVEQAGLTAAWRAVTDAGGRPGLIASEAGEVQAFNHLDKGGAFLVDRALRDADPGDYGALVIPGGVADGDLLRAVPAAVGFARRRFAAGRPAAVICDGPWVLVEAGLIRDRTLASWPSLKTDLDNAGGTWAGSEAQVRPAGPNTLVTSASPTTRRPSAPILTRVFSRQSQSA